MFLLAFARLSITPKLAPCHLIWWITAKKAKGKGKPNLYVDSKRLKPCEASRILVVHHRLKRTAFPIIQLGILIVGLLFIYGMIIINGAYRFRFWSCLTWLYLMPVGVFYMSNGMYARVVCAGNESLYSNSTTSDSGANGSCKSCANDRKEKQ